MKKGSNAAIVRGLLFAAGYVLVVQNVLVPVSTKLLFLSVATLFAGVSAIRLRRAARISSAAIKLPGPLVLSVVLVIGLLALGAASLIWTPETALQDWVRDALTYIMFPVAVLIGSDFGMAARRRALLGTVWTIGVFGAVSFTFTWLQRRGAEGLDIESVGLASSFVPMPAIALGLALFCAPRRPNIGALVSAFAVGGILVLSGGRTIWILLIVGVLFAGFLAIVRFGRVIRVLALCVAGLATGALALAASPTLAGNGIAADRFQWFSRLYEYGWAVFATDGSAVERLRAYDWTLQIWEENFLWGRGWGQPFPSVTTGAVTGSIFTLDSPFVVLAKFGLLGTAVLVLAIIALVRATTVMARSDEIISTSVWVAISMAAVLLLNGFPLENRGFPIFTFCLVAQAVLALREAQTADNFPYPKVVKA
ncbi:hypothetical protein QWJ90_11875 [Microbacterium oryzae]|uniref:O-antigen ligase family protein n=1 Tax=Microbacterium oryzae TaxID=743009 RepID=UPI0025B08E31|nr:O-antigen ligase family protein [Microbacterium oryzae]MDN3311629.1 hypothetical protein [Microbacterium oryzae]